MFDILPPKMIHWPAKMLLKAIEFLYEDKDECLANIIHDTAALYQRRPSEGWKPNW